MIIALPESSHSGKSKHLRVVKFVGLFMGYALFITCLYKTHGDVLDLLDGSLRDHFGNVSCDGLNLVFPGYESVCKYLAEVETYIYLVRTEVALGSKSLTCLGFRVSIWQNDWWVMVVSGSLWKVH